jgi:hypothetical protein
MKVRYLMASIGVASVLLMGAVGIVRAADEWFVLGQQTIRSADPSVEIKGEEGKRWKEDIKKTKISVEGGDVEITKVVLHWNNSPDDSIYNLGVLKSGGQTAPKDAPGHEATLMSVAVQYKILNDAPTATLKVWGYD